MIEPKYFKDPRTFSVLMIELSSVICVLNQGRTGNLGTAAILASKQGFRITFNGRTIAKGGTPKELHEAFQTAVKTARQS